VNTAAKGINSNHLFHGYRIDMRMLFLLATVLVSALCVIYLTNLSRTTLSQLEQAEQQSHQLQLQWGQLLLEQASLATPSRVGQLAADKLHMMLPTDKQTFVLRAQ
jgi:cell division protein FtsL